MDHFLSEEVQILVILLHYESDATKMFHSKIVGECGHKKS